MLNAKTLISQRKLGADSVKSGTQGRGADIVRDEMRGGRMLEQTLRSLHEAVLALNNPECRSILNIDEDFLDSPNTTLEYIGRRRAWIQLRNIAESIPDLLSQSDSIALVGFLGHFSSGKSSLINALLDVSIDESPGYKREVGQHPTDTGITLITHRDHAQLVRKSAYTAVDAVDVVHGPALEFLEHATLVDTPGLGNEEAEHEAVTRFLPPLSCVGHHDRWPAPVRRQGQRL